jgi:hypothetical protein
MDWSLCLDWINNTTGSRFATWIVDYFGMRTRHSHTNGRKFENIFLCDKQGNHKRYLTEPSKKHMIVTRKLTISHIIWENTNVSKISYQAYFNLDIDLFIGYDNSPVSNVVLDWQIWHIQELVVFWLFGWLGYFTAVDVSQYSIFPDYVPMLIVWLLSVIQFYLIYDQHRINAIWI